jgi:choline transport protein
LKGDINIPNSDNSPQDPVNNVGRRLVWGPWHIPGILGIGVNAFSCIYLTIALFWSFWLSYVPVMAENMNYNILLIGATLLMAVVYYLVRGRRDYTGPIVEVSYANKYMISARSLRGMKCNFPTSSIE